MNKYPIYKVKYPVTIQDGIELTTTSFRVLTKREINDLFSLYSTHKFNLMLNVVLTSLSNKEIVNYLSDEEIENLYNEILQLSLPSKEILQTFKSIFKLANDENLKSDTWNCEVCKERELQYDRACGFLPEDKRDKSFKIYAGGEIHRVCPIYKVLQYSDLMNSGYEAYKYYRKGIMPEKGGAYDQTMWFLELSITLDTLIKQQQVDAMKSD